jgi:hypothetical protein
MKAIGDLLNKKKIKKNTALDDKTIFFIFKKVIEEEFGQIGKARFTPDYFAKRVLFVRAQNSAWSAELWMNKARIIKKINHEISEDVIGDIKLK